MANERVSQLQSLLPSSITSDDVFLVTDVKARESKKLAVGDFIYYIERSGSFYAYRSELSDTSSYIKSSNIDGVVALSLNSSSSISSSYTDRTISSSYSEQSDSSSYSLFCVTTTAESDTSSFLKYTGVPNGTSSYSLNSLLSNVAVVATTLRYDGNPNGTASYSISSSNAKSASYSISSSNAITSSHSISSSFSKLASYAETSNFSSTSDSSNIAATASFINSSVYGPKFITPIIIKSSTSAVDWTKYECPTQFIPIGTRVIIVDAYSINNATHTAGFVQIAASSSDTSSAYYIVTAYKTDGGGDNCAFGGQACGPCSSSTSNSSSFYYTFTQPASSATTLRLIGYY